MATKNNYNKTTVSPGYGIVSNNFINNSYDETDKNKNNNKYLKEVQEFLTNETENSQSVKQKLTSLNSFLDKNHDATPFIYFSVNDTFTLNTKSIDSRDHYAISLENVKTGVGAGNQFTLKIAYHKDFSSFKSANDLEGALAGLKDISKDLSKISDMKNDCKLQYGYLDNNMISPVYEGKLLEYSVTANQQILTYTLKGYTSEKAAIGTVNWYPKVKNAQKDSNDEYYIVTKSNQFITQEEAMNATKTQLDDIVTSLDSVYTGPIKMNPFYALDCFLQDYNYSLEKSSFKNLATKFSLVCDKSAEDKIQNLKPVVLSLCRNQTPLEYIEYLVGMFAEEEKNQTLAYINNKNGVLVRWVYEFKQDKQNNRIIVYIRRLSSDDYNSEYIYEFKGYDLNNNLLIDYNLNYDGTVALAVSSTNDDTNDNIYIDSTGAIKKKVSITKDMFTQYEQDKIEVGVSNLWLDKISVANNCSMTTFGIPFEIPVGTVFNVTYKLGDTYHHTSGNCFVLGVTDTIQNNKFTSVFQMTRLPGRSNKL